MQKCSTVYVLRGVVMLCVFGLQVGAVVVGFDRNINYYKIQYACLCIRQNPGCLFIATNLDAVTHLTDAQEWAGNGAMVGAIKGVLLALPGIALPCSSFHGICAGDRLGVKGQTFMHQLSIWKIIFNPIHYIIATPHQSSWHMQCLIVYQVLGISFGALVRHFCDLPVYQIGSSL